MGWEVRDGRRYLYRNRRVSGRPVKEYLAADGPFGELLARDLARLQVRQARVRELNRVARADLRSRIDGIVAAAGTANTELKTVADGLLSALGYRRHHRGEWRMRWELAGLKTLVDQL